MRLTSSKNPILQQIRRAAALGRTTSGGLVVAEGPHLLEEALRGSWKLERVFTTVEGRTRHADLLQRVDGKITEISARALAAASATENSQEVFVLLKPRNWSWHDLVSEKALVVILDGIQDPGNAGTIVRSAEAFGATGVVLTKPSTRLANGKFLRATAGSIFRLPYIENVTACEASAQLRASGLKFYALTAHAATTVEKADFKQPCGLAVGSEAAGISPELFAEAHAVSIPTQTVESLNAAVACSVALFEAYRQRKLP